MKLSKLVWIPFILVLTFLMILIMPTPTDNKNNTANHEQSMKPYQGDQEYTQEEIEKMQNELDSNSHYVMVQNGTETPFRNEYWDNKEEGIYVDKVTGEPLFSSTHKFESGTGWPSFWRAISDDEVTEHSDTSMGMTRTEVRSDGGHLGHLFDDGPQEYGGQRYCINSAALKFVPKEDMTKVGYRDYLYLFVEN